MYIESAQLNRGTEATVRVGPGQGTPSNGTTIGDHVRTPGRSGRRRSLACVAAVCSMGTALLLSGCGQNFSQDGGVIPVPHASTEGIRSVTPVPVPSEAVIGPGYAPPRGERPTQTAVPNLPGGKL
ncbi:hypothetical protein [Parafrankia sp. EUN1f]|uniref:hypothetical protein n=1 Tax=Parafrankia sp. EUN1f TaxID=102897 RepID=UPI0001C471A7|nr:hypothetical protein [Parafrankia sp. EUN1f]EFC79477.1 hypothetical protein FrEUN1fDRAFT_7404 [Parafrankia sp. EUN1f]